VLQDAFNNGLHLHQNCFELATVLPWSALGELTAHCRPCSWI